MTSEALYRAALPSTVDIPTRAIPEFVTPAQRERIATVAERLFAAFETLGGIARASTELDDYLSLTPVLARICRSPSAIATIQSFTRYDVLGDLDGDFQLIECNTGDPSGLGYIDGMVEAHTICGSSYVFDDLAASHVATVAALVDDGCVVLATDRDSPIRTDLVGLARRYAKAGIDVRVADTRDLRSEANTLLHDGVPVDVLHRDLIEEYIEPPFWPAVAPVTELLMRGTTPVLNSFAASLLDSKALLDLLTSAEADNYFDSDTVSFFGRVLPWTRRLSSDTRDLAVQQQNDLVLKPSRGYGGTGITVGRGVNSATWAQRVAAASAEGGFVLQRYVKPAKSQDFDVVYGAWVHSGGFAGAFARVGRGDVLNVHRGGALVPVAYGSHGASTAAGAEI